MLVCSKLLYDHFYGVNYQEKAGEVQVDGGKRYIISLVRASLSLTWATFILQKHITARNLLIFKKLYFDLRIIQRPEFLFLRRIN